MISVFNSNAQIILENNTESIEHVFNYWEHSDPDSIKFFQISRTDLDNLFDADQISEEGDRKVMVTAEYFSDRNDPDQLVIQWKIHDESEYIGALENPTELVLDGADGNKNYYVIRESDIDQILDANHDPVSQYFATLGFHNNFYFLYIWGDTSEFLDHSHELAIQPNANPSSIFTISFSENSDIVYVNIESTTSNNLSKIDFRIDPVPNSHGTGIGIPPPV